ncbi:MAG TPA: TatD family hydrolase [Ruminiclostridium sp.]|nr:TatD family hydrolase [Ruminiclostridium sp.]
MEIFDTHAHYDDDAFESDRDIVLEKTLPESGVCGVVSAGISVESSRANLELAKKYDYIYFAAGIQPEETGKAKSDYLEKLTEILKSSKKAVAVGEIGLDYHWEIDRPTQKRFFEEQLQLANTLNLPVIIHDREAHADTLEYVSRYKPKGTLHCFTGSAETAKEFVSLGLYIGFTGAVTFKNNKKAPKVIESVPTERILVETDCPYMAPEPLRGRRSDSSMIEHTIAFIAAIKGVTAEEMAHITAQNARRLFGLE